MTKPRHPTGCSARSQARGEAWSSDYAWIVNFNNGNVNNDHRSNNNGFVRAVRGVSPPASECQGAPAQDVSLRALHVAWRAAKRGKKPSNNQLAFDSRWADGLLGLQRALADSRWQPKPTVCFIATRPKAREIHAPDFADRVVHHWLVPQLEAIFEPRFIHDSYANRAGKGTHAAITRLRDFVHQVDSGQGGGYYLQLDIRNFFNTIHRPTLWRALKATMQRHGLPIATQHATHALLRSPVKHQGVIYHATPSERAAVPAHKRLENSAPGCGLPIGNLSSQFFANVYLDALDQFVKRELRAKRYLRYVDDFVIVHHSRDQLATWLQQIEAFLRDRLKLQLKADIRLRPLHDGIDFLGYIIHSTHTRVRQRVIAHASTALATWQNRHQRHGTYRVQPTDVRRLQSIWASYTGHLHHANAHRLTERLRQRFPCVALAERAPRFHRELEGKRVSVRVPLPKATTP